MPATHHSQRVGAFVAEDGVAYCVWAPDVSELSTLVTRESTVRRLKMTRDGRGYWSTMDAEGGAGDLYQFEFPDGRKRPDPVSRFQPLGVHGPSQCMAASSYHWQHADWTRPIWKGQVIYELHVGTFTPEGTFRSAISKLSHLRALGVDAIQILPIADFAGERNWGYDGVALYAPARCYGHPDDLRALVDAAHGHGLAVVLDVVYNHLGPSGNYLSDYCADYFNPRYPTPWGPALNLDGERSGAVRQFITENVAYWLDEFRIDGLRLDATHAITDHSPRHILTEISAAAHARGAFLIAEDDRNLASHLSRPEDGGLGMDAMWADDFHHQVRVALTNDRHSYFASFGGSAQDIAEVLQHGWSYRGQAFPFWDGRKRGSASDGLPAAAFVVCLENHDQVGNRARGERLEHLVPPELFRAASLLFCLSPHAPMLFMGQEWAASSPFQFFTDHEGNLGQQISEGRRREFPEIRRSDGGVPDPQDAATFLRSKLKWEETELAAHRGILNLYRQGLRLRRLWVNSRLHGDANWRVEHAGPVIVLRYDHDHGSIVVMTAFQKGSFPFRKLKHLAPLPGTTWSLVLHSENAEFGGSERKPDSPEKFVGPGTAIFETLKRH